MDDLITEIGAFYIVDKGYIDFERLYNLNLNSAYFVTRAKSNFHFKRIYSHQVDKSLGLICDQSIFLKGFYPSKDYPEKLRHIKYFNSQNNFCSSYERIYSIGWSQYSSGFCSYSVAEANTHQNINDPLITLIKKVKVFYRIQHSKRNYIATVILE